jgi:hypothetical protein
MVTRISKDGLWRVSYGELTGLTHDEVCPVQSPLTLAHRKTTHEIRSHATWTS